MARTFKVVLAHQLVESRERDLTESLSLYEEAEKKHKKEHAQEEVGRRRRDQRPRVRTRPAANSSTRSPRSDGAKLAAKILESDVDDTAIPGELEVLRDKAGKKVEKSKQSARHRQERHQGSPARGWTNKKAALDRNVRQNPELAEVAKNLDEARKNFEAKQKAWSPPTRPPQGQPQEPEPVSRRA